MLSQRHIRTARHPIRAQLVTEHQPKVANPDDHDLKLFVLSFTAFFICIYSFIF